MWFNLQSNHSAQARFFCLTDFNCGIWRHLDLTEFYYHIPTSSKFSLATCPAMCKALLAKLERSWAREANSRWGEFEGPIDGATPWCHLDVIRQWLENHLESCRFASVQKLILDGYSGVRNKNWTLSDCFLSLLSHLHRCTSFVFAHALYLRFRRFLVHKAVGARPARLQSALKVTKTRSCATSALVKRSDSPKDVFLVLQKGSKFFPPKKITKHLWSKQNLCQPQTEVGDDQQRKEAKSRTHHHLEQQLSTMPAASWDSTSRDPPIAGGRFVSVPAEAKQTSCWYEKMAGAAARHEISSCEGGLLKRCFLCQGVQRSDEEAREVVEKVGAGWMMWSYICSWETNCMVCIVKGNHVWKLYAI